MSAAGLIRRTAIAVGLAAVFAGCGAGTGVRHANAAAAARGPWRAIVDVSVATLWAQPDRLRPLDAPSARNPADIPAWLAAMSIADREWLVGRVQTQALYGMTVYVLRQSGGWSDVAVRGQSSQLNPIGYPGWMPTRQLTGNLSLLAVQRRNPVGVVRAMTAWLRDPASLAPTIRVSFATRLWITGVSGAYDLVATPRGGTRAIRASALARYRSVSAIPRPTGARIVATARRFMGLQYLWGGTSAYGFDCSGFTYTIYRRFGIPIPRDADRQALHGTPVARASLRPGDLVFFAGPGGTGAVHHVAIYIGSGEVIQAPHTGAAIEIVPLATMMSEYAGARRYL
jgi:cell wall-associated NlpC family hydrolase